MVAVGTRGTGVDVKNLMAFAIVDAVAVAQSPSNCGFLRRNAVSVKGKCTTIYALFEITDLKLRKAVAQGSVLSPPTRMRSARETSFCPTEPDTYLSSDSCCFLHCQTLSAIDTSRQFQEN